MIRTILLLGISLIILTGCQDDMVHTVQSRAIEQTINQSLGSSDEIFNFKMLSIDDVEEGKFAIYRYADQRNMNGVVNPVKNYNIGLAFVRMINDKCIIDTNKVFGTNNVPEQIIYDTVEIEASLIVFGQIINPNIASVTVVFTNGLVVTKPINSQSFFLNAPQRLHIKELKTFDINGNILETYITASSSS